MAMRVCMYCHEQISYERENRNLLAKNGAVGFWTNPLTQQASCPMAPVDSNGQQLHNPGDVHTPPVQEPDEIEKFLDGTYVPKPPKAPCGQMYGLDDKGGFLMCGLDEGHLGDCSPGDQAKVAEQQQNQQVANSAATPVQPGVVQITMDQDVDTQGNVTTTIEADAGGAKITVTYDKGQVSPGEVLGLIQGFSAEAHKLVMADLLGIDPSLIDQAQQAEKDAAKPEVPKAPDLDDVDDVEKFLRGEE